MSKTDFAKFLGKKEKKGPSGEEKKSNVTTDLANFLSDKKNTLPTTPMQKPQIVSTGESTAGEEDSFDPNLSSGSNDSSPNFLKKFTFDGQTEKYNQEHVTHLEDCLRILQDNIDNKEMVSEAMKNIMIHLQEHPELVDIMLPESEGLMVKALRRSYGTTIQKKKTRSSKRAQSAKEIDDMMGELAGFELDI